jgi:hypothetical protein
MNKLPKHFCTSSLFIHVNVHEVNPSLVIGPDEERTTAFEGRG